MLGGRSPGWRAALGPTASTATPRSGCTLRSRAARSPRGWRPASGVVDPFCGSGTARLEAIASSGKGPLGVDASPPGGAAIARARTTTLGEAGRDRLRKEAARIAEESGEHARKRRRPDSPPWAQKEFERFHPHVALELLGLRALVMDTPEDDVGHALRLCLSSIHVKVIGRLFPERCATGQEKRIGRGIPVAPFTDRADELARGLAVPSRACWRSRGAEIPPRATRAI